MFTVISVQQLERLLDQKRPLILVDLRPAQDYQEAHLEEGILDAYWGMPIVFYCEHGGKSMQVARNYARRGFNAISLGCGIPYYRGKYMVSS